MGVEAFREDPEPLAGDDEEGQGLLSDEQQLVIFKIANAEFGVPIRQVQEVIRPGSIVRVPGALDFVEGIMDLRGKVLPVVDLRRHFGLEAAQSTAASRIIVVDIGDMTVGLIVDAIVEVLRLPATAIEPPPRIISGVDSRYVQGIGRKDRRLLILLDLDRIFSEGDRAAVRDAAAEAAPSQAG
jgi:purine-binding chemotaxis protein CheW